MCCPTRPPRGTCLDHAVHGRNGGIAIAAADLVRFFTQMGYDPDKLHLEGITPPVVSVQDIYRQLPNQPDIATRLEHTSGALAKPGNLSPGVIANSAYLADMAALVTNDSRWCSRIPEGLPLARERSNFRDWCLFTLATNTKNAELCHRISVREDGTDPRMSLRERCGFQLNSRYPTNLRYAPEVPDDDDRTRALITSLGYEIPRAKDLPPERIYAAYDRFLDELSHGTDLPHTTARRRLIDRVQRLPQGN